MNFDQKQANSETRNMKQLKQQQLVLVANSDLGMHCNATSFQHQVILIDPQLRILQLECWQFCQQHDQGKNPESTEERRATTGFRVSRDEQTRCTCTYSPSKSSQREQPEAMAPVLPCFRAAGPSFLKISSFALAKSVLIIER